VCRTRDPGRQLRLWPEPIVAETRYIAQHPTSGANSLGPGQDSQVSEQRAARYQGGPFHTDVSGGRGIDVQPMNREREIEIIAEEICAQVPGAILSRTDGTLYLEPADCRIIAVRIVNRLEGHRRGRGAPL
jgi:hypothetical protein